MTTSVRTTHDTFLRRTCQQLGYDDSTLQLLLTASREIRLELPLVRDDGTLVVYNGYRVQHNDARGPYKGGLSRDAAYQLATARVKDAYFLRGL